MLLDTLVQLHESINIVYVVDGYAATLMTQDGGQIVDRAKGDTLIDALIQLEKEVERRNLTLERVRREGQAPKILTKATILQEWISLKQVIRDLERSLNTAGERRDMASCEMYEQQLIRSKAKLELLDELLEYED